MDIDIEQLEYCGNILRSSLMEDFITTVFGLCVWILQVIGDFTGIGYEVANLLIFVIIQPALILLFLGLWLRTRKLRAKN